MSSDTANGRPPNDSRYDPKPTWTVGKSKRGLVIMTVIWTYGDGSRGMYKFERKSDGTWWRLARQHNGQLIEPDSWMGGSAKCEEVYQAKLAKLVTQ